LGFCARSSYFFSRRFSDTAFRPFPGRRALFPSVFFGRFPLSRSINFRPPKKGILFRFCREGFLSLGVPKFFYPFESVCFPGFFFFHFVGNITRCSVAPVVLGFFPPLLSRIFLFFWNLFFPVCNFYLEVVGNLFHSFTFLLFFHLVFFPLNHVFLLFLFGIG